MEQHQREQHVTRFPHPFGRIRVSFAAFAMVAMIDAVSVTAQDTSAADAARRDSLLVHSYQTQVAKGAEWLDQHHLLDNYHAVRAMLTPARVAKLFPSLAQASAAYTEAYLDWVAQYVAVSYSADSIRRLEAAGVDILRAFGSPTVDSTPKMRRLAWQSDVVVVGELVSVDTAANLGDGFMSTVTISIVEILKGRSPTDTIRIRQESGLMGNGRVQLAPGELVQLGPTGRLQVPTKGSRFVFFLSKGRYALHVIEEGKVPQNESFYIYRSMPFPLEGDRVSPPRDGSFGREDVPSTLSALRESVK